MNETFDMGLVGPIGHSMGAGRALRLGASPQGMCDDALPYLDIMPYAEFLEKALEEKSGVDAVGDTAPRADSAPVASADAKAAPRADGKVPRPPSTPPPQPPMPPPPVHMAGPDHRYNNSGEQVRSGWSARLMRMADHWANSNWQALELIIEGTKVGEIAAGSGYWYERSQEVFDAYEKGDWATCDSLLEAARVRFDSITTTKGKGKNRYPMS